MFGAETDRPQSKIDAVSSAFKNELAILQEIITVKLGIEKGSDPIQAAILHGSIARGTDVPESDADYLVVTKLTGQDRRNSAFDIGYSKPTDANTPSATTKNPRITRERGFAPEAADAEILVIPDSELQAHMSSLGSFFSRTKTKLERADNTTDDYLQIDTVLNDFRPAKIALVYFYALRDGMVIHGSLSDEVKNMFSQALIQYNSLLDFIVHNYNQIRNQTRRESFVNTLLSTPDPIGTFKKFRRRFADFNPNYNSPFFYDILILLHSTTPQP